MVTPEFWRGRRVFLTGHTGFKGGWLSLWLHAMGAEVHGYALAPDNDPNLFSLAGIGDLTASTLADVRDPAAVAAAMARCSPSVVFHLAAQALVRESYADPLGTYATNVMGTAHVLEAARHCPGIEAVVIVTTDKCYENREWPWGYRENDSLGGHDPYSSSKACAELITAAYRLSFPDMPYGIASARAGNVIGGGDWAADRLLPDLVQAFARQASAPIRNPHATRPWQHVLEPLSGYLMLAERLAAGDASAASAWNFGPPDDSIRSVSWIADRLAHLWGPGARWHQDPGHHPHEARSLALDSTKARTQLGWTPHWDIGTALSATVDWHRAFAAGTDMREFSLAQIAAYAAACPKASL